MSTSPPNITTAISSVSPNALRYGGLSDVYMGIWRNQGSDVKVRMVAIKVLRLTDPSSEKMRRRFEQECVIWYRLRHDNIHPMCGLYQTTGRPYAMVSPWCDNGDIIHYLKQIDPGPVQEVRKLSLLSDIFAGLTYMHWNGVVHADIKGANILVSDDGIARLSDFGYSRIISGDPSTTEPTSDKGTYRWMAPELLLDQYPRHTAETDMWASGCLVLEVQSGLVPYYNMARNEKVILAITSFEIPQRPANVPESMWALTVACLKSRPRERMSADTLLAHLRVYHMLYTITNHAVGTHIEPPEAVPLLASLRRSASSASILDASSHQALWALSEISRLDIFMTCSRWEHVLQPLKTLLRICVDRAACGILQLSGGCMLSTASTLISALSYIRPPASGLVVMRYSPDRLRPLARALAIDNRKVATTLMQLLSNPAVGNPIHSHAQTVIAVTWLARGIVSASWRGSLHLHTHDLTTGRIQTVLTVRCPAVLGVEFSPDGSLLACFFRDGSMSLFDTHSSEAHVDLMHGHTAQVSCAAFSHTANFIVTASKDTTLRIWDVRTGETKVGPMRGHEKAVTAVAYSPDDCYIVSGSEDGAVYIWDVRDNSSAREPVSLARYTTAVRCVAVSRDGNRVISSGHRGIMHVWNTRIRQMELGPLCGFKSIISFACSPDGTRIALLTVDGIQMFNLDTGVLIGPFKPYIARDVPVAFSPDGRYLVSCGWDDSLQIWDATGEYLRWDIP